MEDLSNFISTVGFPIVVSIMMFYQNNVSTGNFQKLTQQVTNTLEQNSQTITRLIEKLNQDILLNKGEDNGSNNGSNK